MKRIIAMLLAIVMLVGNVPVQAFAAEGQPEPAACATRATAAIMWNRKNRTGQLYPVGPQDVNMVQTMRAIAAIMWNLLRMLLFM